MVMAYKLMAAICSLVFRLASGQVGPQRIQRGCEYDKYNNTDSAEKPPFLKITENHWYINMHETS